MESEINFILNNQEIKTKINPSTVLLDYIRKDKKLTGTKEVCKEGDCGACTVLLGELTKVGLKYKTINSCIFPIQNVDGKHVVTIEGINQENLNIIQHEFVNQGASQCGFCTPGFIISLTGYLLNSEKLEYDEMINSVAGNICRCTGYNSIKKSIEKIKLNINDINLQNNNKLAYLIKSNILPKYFSEIEQRLNLINSTKVDNPEFHKNIHSVFIGGGTDLFVQKAEEMCKSNVHFIYNIPQPKILINDSVIIIHSSTTIEELKDFFEKNIPNINFNTLFKLFASKPIRNSATIGGNIVNASPIGDMSVALLSLNAKLILKNSKKETRKVNLDKFYFDYKKYDLNSDEIIDSVSIPIPNSNFLFNFEKVSKRNHLDIASVNSSMLLEIIDNKIAGARLAAGGVAPIPLYFRNTSEFLINKEISMELVKESVEIAKSEISPISDIRGSKDYKTLLLGQLIKAHFIEMFPQIINHEVLI
ncbi:MAG: FAD binding domain-containing protein [Ignavibacteriae bacterium]|nr:FAD binding domain-containing protein [Ignavibacteriota bacterium]